MKRQAPAGRGRHPVALAVLALLAVPAAFAQSSNDSSDDPGERVIVTGTRVPKAVDKIPGAVTLVSREEIQQTLNLTDDVTAVLARTVPGYAESSQAMSNTGENLRGRIALRLFDGVPQGSPLREGTRNATFTDMGIVGRIEVINGPSASEGIGAAGGIINYISKKPTKKGDEFELTTRYSTQFKDDSADWKVGLTYAHLDDNWDLLAAVSHIDRGMAWDGRGNRIGMNSSGSLMDTKTDNVFVKGGFNFGKDREQRVTASYSNFEIDGKSNYTRVEGDRSRGIVNTSAPVKPLLGKSEFNHFEQAQVTYEHANLFGGALNVNLYSADQAMRYLTEQGNDRIDPVLNPTGIDQSEIRSQKLGLRSGWVRSDIFGVGGLELRAGVDVVRDEAEQRLALSNRLWVPPMVYKSVAPYAQLSYDIGPITLSGGLRREDGELSVDTYTTIYRAALRRGVTVEGGKLSYTANLPNAGIVWRVAPGWSVYGSYSKGFTLPNVGIPLRNIAVDGQRVDGILDLQAVIVKNAEIGANWRGKMGALSAAYYESRAAAGSRIVATTTTDPVTNLPVIEFTLDRTPAYIKGIELTGELILSREWRANAMYSRIRGKTAVAAGGPVDVNMGALDIAPDKIVVSGTWKPVPAVQVTLSTTQIQSRTLDNVKIPTNGNRLGTERTTGYGLWDLVASYDMGRWGKLTLGIENLTDKFYVPSGSQVDPNFGPGFSNYWSGRGRVVSVTHTVTF
ncbi:MAG: TonB-dependent receptor [Rubrivivax sp.]